MQLETINEVNWLHHFEGQQPKRYSKGDIVAFPQDKSNRVFYVESGILRVYLSYGGKNFTLALLSQGDVYCSHTRAFVEAVEPSAVHSLELHQFAKQLASNTQLVNRVTRVLSSTLAGCIDVIENLAFRDVKSRFACFLLSQVTEGGATHSTITLPLSIELLAQSIGTSRQTLSTIVSDLVREDILIRLSPKRLIITDYHALQALAEI